MNFWVLGATVLSGGLAGAFAIIVSQRIKWKREYRASIFGFCTGFISTFGRCVSYCEQLKKGEFSFSTLFDFPDMATLSRFSSVCNKPEIYASVIEIKSNIFQVGRHVEQFSKYVTERKLSEAAIAQGKAIAFFRSGYDGLVKNIEMLLKEAEDMCLDVTELKKIFTTSKERYDSIVF